MGSVRERIAELDLVLPAPFAAPPGVELRFDPVLVHGREAWVAGAGPTDGSRILVQGVVGDDLTVADGRNAARLTALAVLASLEGALGDLDRVAAWARVAVYVNSVPRLPGLGLTQVADGFSDVVLAVWGEAGRHARVAPGVHALPFNLPVVVEATLLLSQAAC